MLPWQNSCLPVSGCYLTLCLYFKTWTRSYHFPASNLTSFPLDGDKAPNSLMWPPDSCRMTTLAAPPAPLHPIPRLAQPQNLCPGCVPCLIFAGVAPFCHLGVGFKATAPRVPLAQSFYHVHPLHVLFTALTTIWRYLFYLLVGLFIACFPH